MLMLAVAIAVGLGGGTTSEVFKETVPGLIMGMVGVMCGWLAWWGAVEPLAPLLPAQDGANTDNEAGAVVPCGICGQVVKSEVRAECAYRCGRYFHTGCLRARQSVYTGDPTHCAVCNVKIA